MPFAPHCGAKGICRGTERIFSSRGKGTVKKLKIKTMTASYEEVMRLPRAEHKNPSKPSFLLRTVIRIAGAADLKDAEFTYSKDISRAGKGPYLILMNHSSFIDLEIVSKIFYPMPYNIVCTSDGFVGKEWLMRHIGCIPTQKFVNDITLIRDIKYSLQKKKTSVLMYPEASYSFDGTATPLPRKLGGFLKHLDVPVLFVRTYGAFLRDPLYNCLKKRKVKVSADVTCLFSAEEVRKYSKETLEKKLDAAFTFDHFEWQQKNGVAIDEPFRADGLERILFRCASCGEEGKMKGENSSVFCRGCGKRYLLNRFGKLEAEDGNTEFEHIPDWYKWQRRCVRSEIENGTYRLDTDVKIGIMVDYKAIYMVGKGHLTHDESGFHLTGCDGKLDYFQKPLASYGLYSDYYWYEIGDVICIGDKDCLYYCFPEKEGVVAKTRIAAEELYKIAKEKSGLLRV